MAQAERTVTYDEYLALDDNSAGTKHEFDNGQIVAMSGGSLRHSELAFRVNVAVGNGLKQGCRGFQSDGRVRILTTGRATYPDLTVVCGPIERDPADTKGRTITNPTLIVEVLSPTTEADDRGAKWGHYMRVTSLKEYILVSQDEPRVERYRRDEKGSWEYTDFRSGTIELASGGMLDIDKLYTDLPEAET